VEALAIPRILVAGRTLSTALSFAAARTFFLKVLLSENLIKIVAWGAPLFKRVKVPIALATLTSKPAFACSAIWRSHGDRAGYFS
jgi:hypothetical protein